MILEFLLDDEGFDKTSRVMIDTNNEEDDDYAKENQPEISDAEREELLNEEQLE